MMSNDERARDAEPAGEIREAADSPRTRPRQRVVSEAVVAALSEEREAERGGGADDGDGAGA